jgi:hypothetical protein
MYRDSNFTWMPVVGGIVLALAGVAVILWIMP